VKPQADALEALTKACNAADDYLAPLGVTHRSFRDRLTNRLLVLARTEGLDAVTQAAAASLARDEASRWAREVDAWNDARTAAHAAGAS
jgi:hypothetical protein